MPGTYSFSDVFISYSRKDKDFVLRLNERLKEHGQEAWVDWEDIPATAEWWAEIQAGIDGANTFMFVISPNSVMSDVCYREIDHAVRTGKRFVPILYREVTDPEQQKRMHPAIGSHNWIFFQDDTQFDAHFSSLIDALQTDLDYVRAHTRLLVQAREWDQRGRDNSFLLSGTAVREAQGWLARAASMKPAPTTLHAEYIVASQQAAARRQRRILAGVTVALAVALALAALSLILYGQSEQNRALAEVNAAAAATNESIAVTNAEEAQQQAATSQANATLANRNAQIAQTNEARANSNAALASTNEAEAFLRGTAVAYQAATSQANATLANRNAQIAQTNEARANSNAALASTNEAEAFLRGTAVAYQAATSQANADLAATNAAEAKFQADRAITASRRAQAIALAARAETALAEDDHRDYAILLGIEALENRPYTWQAERVLGAALRPGSTRIPAASMPEPMGDPLLAPDGALRLMIPHDRPQQVAVVRTADQQTQWTLIGHTSNITGAAWSPDGRWIATISADRTARIWDASTGQSERILIGHSSALSALAWSPDSQRLLTAADKTLHLWQIVEGAQPLILTFDAEGVERLMLETDSVYLLSTSGAAFRWQLWANPNQLVARARAQVRRRLTDEEAALAGLPPAPSAPPPAEIQGCPDALPTRLYPGVFARVSSQNNLLALRLRENPGLSSSQIALIAPDQTFQVLDGPVCRDGFAWFEVVYGLDARLGWAAEGAMTADGPDYFAEPIPGR
jgi:chemotaxis protein histidine kinase CheA